MPAVARPGGDADQVGGRAGEHEPTLAVEVPGHRIERDDEPRREAAELLGGRPHPSVGDRRLRGGEGARQLADRVRGDARAIRNPLRRKSRGRLAQEGKAVRESGQVPQVRATVLEEHLQHR